MSDIPVYSPEEISAEFIVGGVALSIQGFADGTTIEAQRSVDNTTETVGMQGDVATTKMANKTGTIAFTLLQNSDTNFAFSKIQYAQDFSGAPLIRGNLEIRDPSGSMICRGQGAYIKTPATVAIGDDQNNKTWTFFCSKLEYVNTPSGLSSTLSTLARIQSQVDSVISAARTIEESILNQG